jgi:antitoxin VapB
MGCGPTMAPNFADEETEKLAAEIAKLAGESEEEAVRQALRERRDRLQLQRAGERRKPKGSLHHFLETEIWPQVPDELLDRPPMTKAEREEILGIGPEGY